MGLAAVPSDGAKESWGPALPGVKAAAVEAACPKLGAGMPVLGPLTAGATRVGTGGGGYGSFPDKFGIIGGTS